MSGLCNVHPHLGKACKNIGIQKISVNLLEPGFEPSLLKITRELQLSTYALREKFSELLKVEKINIENIMKAYALFSFYKDSWPSSCYIEIFTQEGKKLEIAVDSIGNTAEELGGHN
ncbi:MAG: hypothetical protein OQJ93_04500 [Ignavibacteriaceae bacterium]|jgi:hypothetical protein|nr:hypothetical protein [Ignavibacteriaceae bacterium]